MYGVVGGKATGREQIRHLFRSFIDPNYSNLQIISPNTGVRVVELYPPISSYIKTSFDWNLIYELVAWLIENYFNYASSCYLTTFSG